MSLYKSNKIYIELIGITGVGKSTYLKKLIKKLKTTNKKIFTSYDYFLFNFGINISNHLIKTLLIDFFAFFWLICTFYKEFKVYRFIINILLKCNGGLFFKLNVLRNFTKKFMLHRFIINSDATDTIIVADEGMIQQVHAFFVHPENNCNLKEIELYLSHFKIPDRLYLLDIDKETLINRIQKRGHQRINVNCLQECRNFINCGKIVYNHIFKLCSKNNIIKLNSKNDRIDSINNITNPF